MIRVIIYLIVMGLLAVSRSGSPTARRSLGDVAGLAARNVGDDAAGRNGDGGGDRRDAVVACALDLAFAGHAGPLSRRAPRHARIPRGVARADRDRSGDVRAARKYVEEANRHAPGEPLRCCSARRPPSLPATVQAERAFHQMAAATNPAARPARPLHRSAAPRRRRDAQLYAEEAAGRRRCRPGPARRCSNSVA